MEIQDGEEAQKGSKVWRLWGSRNYNLQFGQRLDRAALRIEWQRFVIITQLQTPTRIQRPSGVAEGYRLVVAILGRVGGIHSEVQVRFASGGARIAACSDALPGPLLVTIRRENSTKSRRFF